MKKIITLIIFLLFTPLTFSTYTRKRRPMITGDYEKKDTLILPQEATLKGIPNNQDPLKKEPAKRQKKAS